MKLNLKFLFPIFISIVIGFLFGKIIFNQYNASLTVSGEGNVVYFVKSGIFKSMEDVKKVYQNIDTILVINKENGYHTYVGLTLNQKNANRIQEYYEKNGYDIYVEEQIIINERFITSLNEYDKILSISNSKSDIEAIEKAVISSYKELIINEP